MERFVTARSRRIACMSCRQNKSRCEKGQGPCTRCKRHGLTCREDPGFQRMSKNRKIEELEKQVKECVTVISQTRQEITNNSLQEGCAHIFQEVLLEQLPDPLNVDDFPFYNTHSIIERHTESCSPTREFSDLPNSVPQFHRLSNAAPGNYEQRFGRPLATISRSLGTVDVNKVQIDALFRIFFDNYHPFLPFLFTSLSPDECFNNSPLLFWTIVAVAARRFDEDITLLRFLSAPVTQLAWDTTSKLPSTLATVQALLILCTWPFAASSLWLEPTPIWTGIAVSIAQQLGLHRPDSSAEFMRVKQPTNTKLEDERLRTWMACCIVSQNTSATFGSLPVTSFRLSVPITREERYIERLPPVLKHQFMIQRFCNKVVTVMFNTEASILDFQPLSDVDSLVLPLETEFQGLEESVRVFSRINQLYLLSARLFLHIHYFFVSISSDSKLQGILKAYAAAESVISVACNADLEFDLFSHINSYLFRMLFTAACVIWKVRNSSYSSHIDLDVGKILFNKAVSSIRKCSIENNDNAGRQAEILVQLWHGRGETQEDSRRSQDPTLEINSRYSASLAYECLLYWRDNIGGQITNGQHACTTLPVEGVRGLQSSPTNSAHLTLDQGVANDSQTTNQVNFFNWAWDLAT